MSSEVFETLHFISEDSCRSDVNRLYYFTMSELLYRAALGYKYDLFRAGSIPERMTKDDIASVKKMLRDSGLSIHNLPGGNFIVSWEDNVDLES